MKKDNKTKILALLYTFLFSGIIVLILLCFGLMKQVPPPPEYGVELNFGNALIGMGDIQPEALTSQAVSSATSSASEPSEFLSDNNDEAAIEKPKPKSPTKPTQVKPTENTHTSDENQTQTHTLNPNALFPGNKNTQSSGEGTGNVAGDQGDPGGTAQGTAYTGTPGTGGGGSGGVAYTLTGRQATSLVKPSYNSDEQATVVVKIWVDESGKVTRAEAGEKGTNTTSSTLLKAAYDAAMKSKFSTKEGAIPQQGSITYKFVKLN